MLFLQTSSMLQPASAPIEDGVLDVLKNVSRRPIEPSLSSDLVADLGFDSLQILEVIAELEDRFDISIPLNDVPATRTVAQVVAQVARLVEDRSKALCRHCEPYPRRWRRARAPMPAIASSRATSIAGARMPRCTRRASGPPARCAPRG